MKTCCKKTFKLALEEVLFNMKQAKFEYSKDYIKLLEYSISEVEKDLEGNREEDREEDIKLIKCFV